MGMGNGQIPNSALKAASEVWLIQLQKYVFKRLWSWSDLELMFHTEFNLAVLVLFILSVHFSGEEWMSPCDFQYKGFRQLAATGQLGFCFGFIEFKRLTFSAENWLKYVRGTKKSDFKLYSAW